MSTSALYLPAPLTTLCDAVEMLAARASPAKIVTRVTFAASKRARAAAIVRATKKESNSSKDEDEAKIDFKGLKQLVSMGLGTISGDITEINLKDPKRTVVMELGAFARM